MKKRKRSLLLTMLMAVILVIGMMPSMAFGAVDKSAENEASEMKAMVENEETGETAAPEGKAESKESAAEDDNEAAEAEKDAEESSADESSDEVKAKETDKDSKDKASKKTSSVLTYSGKDYKVTVEYGSKAKLPDDVELAVSEYKSKSKEYKERYEEAASLCDLEDEEADVNARLFDIGLYTTGDNGQKTEVEPAASVQVTITYEDESDAEDYTVVHFGDKTETIDPETTDEKDGQQIAFDVTSFSDFMVLALQGDYQYVILNEGNINGSWRDDSGSLDRYTGYRPWATITGYNGANYDYYGNGTGTGSMVGYGGFADDWRITAEIPVQYFDDHDDQLTITLPSDSDLPESDWHDDRSTFYIYGDEDSDDNVSVLLPKENAYDYKLVGWINIGTGEYTSVRNGSAEVTVNGDDENIFYADWEAATYNVGKDDGNVADTVSTDFVTVDMFDYNELFNLYSTEYTLDGDYNGEGSKKTTANDKKEDWTIGSTFKTEPLGDTQLGNVGSFAFYDGPDARDQNGMLGFPNERGDQSDGTVGNQSNYSGYQGNRVNITDHLGVNTWDDAFFTDYLFNKNAEADGVVGVDYVGQGDQLFKYGEEGDEIAEENGYVGYYYYDSRYNSASYNQSEERFYVYNDPTEVGDNSYPEGFYPYNYYGDELDDHDGSVNYFFGMNMDVDFYLPNVVGKQNGNTVDGKDMTFNFSGDDDIWIFVDDELVLDMSGIHNKSYGSIDFCTGKVSLETTDTSGNIVYTDEELNDISGMQTGEHKLRVYYLERGGDASNMIVSFNLAPTWEYESDNVGTVSVDKEWQNAKGKTLSGRSTSDCPDVTVGLYEKKDGDYELVEMPTDADGNSFFENPVTLSYDKDATYTDPATGKEKKSYGWHYDWELLDADKVEAGDYIVKEISSSSDYTKVKEDKKKLKYDYDCWTIVGETEIETWMQDHENGAASSRYPVILTDAASDDSENVFGRALYIDTSGSSPSLTSKALTFSRHPEETTTEDPAGFEVTTGVYGIGSDTEVSAADPGITWYLEYAEVPEGDVLDVFHICYEADGTTYYLAVNYDGSDAELELSTQKDQNVEDGYYDEFYCDELGEVRLYDLQYRLVLSSDGSVSVAAIDQDHYEHNNIKLYTLSTLEDTPDYNFTFVNQLKSDENGNGGGTNPNGTSGTNGTGNGGGTTYDNAVNTGDDSNMLPWILLLAAALICGIGVICSSRIRQRR